MNAVVSFTHVGSPASEPLHYTMCGLDNIYIEGGYQIRDIGGEKFISVRDVEDLHKAIAVSLVRGKKALVGKEVRFLRKHLDLTQRELGQFLMVSDQTIARYEKDQTPLEGSADGLLRLLVAGQILGCIDVREELENLREADDTVSDKLMFRRDHDEWRAEAYA